MCFIKHSYLVLTIIISSLPAFAQNAGDAFNPMTASGASGIHRHYHILFWENPDSVVFNEVYFSDDSLKVASSDSSAIIYEGYPSSVIDSAALSTLGDLNTCTKYYWKVAEHYTAGVSDGKVWWFTTSGCHTPFTDDFENGLGRWTITTQSGCPWDTIKRLSRNYLLPPEAQGNVLAADADLCGSGGGGSSGSATVSITNTSNIAGYTLIEWDNDWQAISAEDSAFVEVSYDNGISWINIVSFTEDVRNTHEYQEFQNSHQPFLLRFRSVQPSWDWWWAVDNIVVNYIEPITPPTPPRLLKTRARYEEQVTLNWSSGGSPNPITGYRIQRKAGLPTDTSSYLTIGEPASNEFTFTDSDVNFNEIYTYRIATRTVPSGAISNWGNEATAYVPPVTPVELTSFTAAASNGAVTLNWTTATETNNKGFEIERSTDREDWGKIGFAHGSGTTTTPQVYSYTDRLSGVTAARLYYRLKQLDFDGSYIYSYIVTAEIAPSLFTLAQNYPNPFNPSTKIKFELAVYSKVSVKVYNLLGQQVAELLNGEYAAGRHEINFNAAQLSSGIYFYVINAEGKDGSSFRSTKKMTLMK